MKHFNIFTITLEKHLKKTTCRDHENGHKDQSKSRLEITHELQYDKEQQRLVQKRETSINNDQRVV